MMLNPNQTIATFTYANQTQAKKERNHILSFLMEQKNIPLRLLEWAAVLSLENSEWNKAEYFFSNLTGMRNKASDWLNLALSLHKQSKIQDAESCCLEAICKIKQASHHLYLAYKLLADIYFIKKDFLMAEEYYNKAGTLQSSCKDILFAKAMIYLKENKYYQAITYFKKVITQQAQHTKSWIGLALARKALKDHELAQACLKRCLDFDSGNHTALKLQHKWTFDVKNLAYTFTFVS